jgi:hypothetical protein
MLKEKALLDLSTSLTGLMVVFNDESLEAMLPFIESLILPEGY